MVCLSLEGRYLWRHARPDGRWSGGFYRLKGDILLSYTYRIRMIPPIRYHSYN